MDSQGFQDQSNSGPRKKPFDLWLALLAFAVGIAMTWIPKTPPFLIGSLLLIFILLLHPIWHFWWIEKKLWTRCSALILVAFCLTAFGYYVWPNRLLIRPTSEAETTEQQKKITSKEETERKNIQPQNKQEVTPKTEQPKHPTGVDRPEVQVKLIFKDSPLFTPEREQKITIEIDAFRKYLTGLGFDVPKEIPPIGTSPGKGWTATFGSYNAPVFYDSIMIGDKEIDNSSAWRRASAHHFFQKIFPWHPTDTEIESPRTWIIWIFTEYFESSYTNRRPKKSNGMNGWVNALWDIRDSCGKEFTDGSLFYTSKIEMQNEDKKDFNKYFSKWFIIGSHVLDNNFRNRPKIFKILRQYYFLQ